MPLNRVARIGRVHHRFFRDGRSRPEQDAQRSGRALQRTLLFFFLGEQIRGLLFCLEARVGARSEGRVKGRPRSSERERPESTRLRAKQTFAWDSAFFLAAFSSGVMPRGS